MLRRSIRLLVILFVSLACSSNQTRFDVDLSGVPVQDVKISRYGKALFELDKTRLKVDLMSIQPNFRVFLDGDLEQPGNIEKIRSFIDDTLLISVYGDCKSKFSDISWLEKDLGIAFRYLRFYFPTANNPEVFSYISGFDYQHAVHFNGEHLLIALDMYLGQEYPYYRQLGLPAYVLTSFSPEYILRDCIEAIATYQLENAEIENHLLGRMILEGKRLWFVKAMIPDIKMEILFDYLSDKMTWANQHEGHVWAFMVENQLLFSTESGNLQKFIRNAPFTSFFGNDSPPRLGWFIGYRIVESFMNKNRNITLEQLLDESDSQKILNNSGYKPPL